mgnify:CR=1 FL=1
MGTGMGDDQRRIRASGGIPKTLFVDMRQVDQNSQAVACFYQLPTGITQPRSGIRGTGKFKGDSVGKRIGATPGKAQ